MVFGGSGASLLATLDRLARIATGADLRVIGERATAAIREEFGLAYVAIMLLDDDGAVLHHLAESTTLSASTPAGFVLPVTEGLIGRAIRAGASVFVADVHDDPDYVEAILGVNSELVIPLRAGDRIIGVLDCEATEPTALAERAELMELAASRLAITLDNARLLREQAVAGAALARKARELELLNEVARAATGELELRPMMQRIVDAIRRGFGWEFVALVRVERDGARFVCEALSTDLPTEIYVGYSRPYGSGVIGEVAVTGQTIVIDDVRAWPNYVETLPGARSEVCVPAIYRGEVVALLNLESRALAAFRDQVGLLSTVTEQIAGAIANARLFEEVRRHANQLAMLSDVSLAATASTDLGGLLERVARFIHDRLGVPLVSLHLLDHLAGELELVAHAGGPVELSGGGREPIGRGVVGRAARTGVVQVVLDVSRDPDFVRINPATRAELAAPIRFGEQVLGVLNLESPHPSALRDLEDVVVTLADQIAGALRMARVNQRLTDNHRLLADLFARYVAPDLVQVLLTDPERFRTHGERREVSVMFADIRGFTGLTQRMSSQDVLRLLNEFYAAMGEAIFGQRGSINQILGDGLMAVFGVPERLSGHAAAAVAAGLEMQRRIDALSPRWEALTGGPLSAAIAINTGEVTVGTIGDPRHLSFTVLGDVVNVAARLETEAKARNARLLVTDATRAACPGLQAVALGAVELRGRTGEVGIHQLL